MSTRTALLFVALCSCATGRDAAAPLVQVRATKDLDCPQNRIVIESSVGGVWTANGCGHSVTYQSACEHLECSVTKEGEEAPGWRDRAEPGSIEAWGH
jgi:hypothetical protein